MEPSPDTLVAVTPDEDPGWAETCYLVLDSQGQTRACYLDKQTAIKAAYDQSVNKCLFHQVVAYPMNSWENIIKYNIIWTSEALGICCCFISSKREQADKPQESVSGPPSQPVKRKRQRKIQTV